MKDDRELAYSTMANYLSSLYSLSLYVFESTDNFDVPDAVRNTDHTVVDACLNLRSQCESLAKEHGLYAQKRGGWMTSAAANPLHPHHHHLSRCRPPRHHPPHPVIGGRTRRRRASSAWTPSPRTMVPTRRS